MLYHGVTKLSHGVGMISGLLTKAGWPEFLAYGVYFGEVIQPVFILIEFFTRLAARGTMAIMFVAIGLVVSDKFSCLVKPDPSHRSAAALLTSFHRYLSGWCR